MNATQIAVTVGQGTAVHAGLANDEGNVKYTACGAEGRGYRQSRIRVAPAGSEVTCPRCAKATRIS